MGIRVKVGVVAPNEEEVIKGSPSVYRSHVLKRLPNFGVEIIRIDKFTSSPPDVDLLWDPFVSSGRSPAPALNQNQVPVVTTVHGPGPWGLPLKERLESIETLKDYISLFRGRIEWALFWSKKVDKVVTVSSYAKRLISKKFNVRSDKIRVIHSGVDKNLFNKRENNVSGKYLLHVSSGSKAKNIEKIVKAYSSISEDSKPRLKIITNGDIGNDFPNGVDIIRDGVDHKNISKYYKNAVALVQPSLKETFGLPIVEAMACGCPVITASTTACAEVAGDAALLVDPTNTDDIQSAMMQVTESREMRQNLSNLGTKKSKYFDWKNTAKKYAVLFRQMK